MRLICVRHGATPLSQQKRLCGWTDVALSALGREQATRTAQELRGGGYRFTKVYASPLLRCQETARLLAPGREIIPLAEMKESFYGAFEGMEHAQAQRADPEGYRRWMEHWRTVGPVSYTHLCNLRLCYGAVGHFRTGCKITVLRREHEY